MTLITKQNTDLYFMSVISNWFHIASTINCIVHSFYCQNKNNSHADTRTRCISIKTTTFDDRVFIVQIKLRKKQRRTKSLKKEIHPFDPENWIDWQIDFHKLWICVSLSFSRQIFSNFSCSYFPLEEEPKFALFLLCFLFQYRNHHVLSISR